MNIESHGYQLVDPSRPIGEGAYGVAYRCRKLSDPSQDLVCKIIPIRDKSVQSMVATEYHIGSLIGCNSGRLLCIRDLKFLGGRALIVSDYIPNARSLEDLLYADLRRGDQVKIMTDLAMAVSLLHNRGFIHGDISSGNVLWNGHQATLIDYGLSCIFHETRNPELRRCQDPTASATEYTIAPELYRGGKPNPKTDIYALGVVYYRLLTSRQWPYIDNYFDFEDLGDYLNGAPRFNPMPESRSAFEPLIKSMIARDPTQRPSLDEILIELDKFR